MNGNDDCVTHTRDRMIRSRTKRDATRAFFSLPLRHSAMLIVWSAQIHPCPFDRSSVEPAPSRPAGRKALGYCLSRRRTGFDSRRPERTLRP